MIEEERKVLVSDSSAAIPFLTNKRKPIGFSRSRVVHQQFKLGNREMLRAARLHAEQWYQALKVWDVFESQKVFISQGIQRHTRAIAGTVGRGWQSGGHEGVSLLKTPIGGLEEAKVGAQITWLRDELLERIRAGGGLASLLDPRGGWSRRRALAVKYALAVLSLAALLGDPWALCNRALIHSTCT